ncbi:RAMP superfamily CRISPR-associated protein [Litoreibacter janthinus]|uniref:CRISPR/Cas system CSM-associated protein Csm3, group 7 of RAMP superfamily n=1 Tax=Litoreibacter janthinus TaxID=670154 RepID=A0A1I6H0E3_9RHOB|nr:RAMP superfamily CRISPR-associated protein [Litoreibacter janthinus]SFR47870.1 CRISPR/Cas system CSM-associated protein Csm3, group 7 of RAMP superfamily [Litoreibacter janthinus]
MQRVSISVNFQTRSVLHIGTGAVDETPEGEADIAAITIDQQGNPWIPGSTLKGALRAACDGAAKDLLFGTPHEMAQISAKAANTDTTSQSRPKTFRGLVTVTGATCATDKTLQISRTHIDPGTGVAEATKLFTTLYVEVGTKFQATFWLDGPIATGNADLTEFLTVLSEFATPEGREIGAGKADGLGRIAITGDVTIKRMHLTQRGYETVSEESKTLTPPTQSTQPETFVLECPGPYLVRDGTKPESAAPDAPQITTPLRNAATDAPRQIGTGISGALRARAAWLLALAEHREDATLSNTPKPCPTSSGPQDLSVLKRLFGDTGYRARLKLMVTHISCKKPPSFHPSVAIDPISQAPYEGALFKIEADHGVALNFTLTPWQPLDEDEDLLFQALCTDIRKNGLTLGAGTTKGFGWFQTPNTDLTTAEIKHHRPDPSAADTLLDRLPDERVTLPYRNMAVDLHRIGLPPQDITEAWRNSTLHDQPLNGGVSGWLDVTWCFETPMLIGDGKTPCAPQRIDGHAVLPGTTLRGNLRAIVAAATSARLTHVNPVADAILPAVTGPLQAQVQALLNSPIHSPAPDENFAPDFTEALFGYIRDRATDDTGPATHRRLHLKSRLSFGFATLTNNDDLRLRMTPYSLVMGGPNPSSNLYDQIARKTYPADTANPDRVRTRLTAHAANPEDNTVSTLKFLHPAANGLLQFRGRIRFHNVLPQELGALLWAVTWGGDPRRRHRIGHAKAFGAGKCFASGLHLHVQPNDTSTPVAAIPPETSLFGLQGHGIMPYLNAFTTYLSDGRLSGAQSFEELVSAARPEIGRHLRGQDVRYQTWEQLRDHAPEIRTANGGRLAAMLKP